MCGLERGRGQGESRGLLGVCLGLGVFSGGPGYPKGLVTTYPVQRLHGPGSAAEHTPTLFSPSQYTAKLERELQNLRVGVENLDLLSPAGLRDLEALQSSGLGGIHYPGFLAQVSGALRPDHGEQRGHTGARAASGLVLSSLDSPTHPWVVFPNHVPQAFPSSPPPPQRMVVNEPPPTAYVTIHSPEPTVVDKYWQEVASSLGFTGGHPIFSFYSDAQCLMYVMLQVKPIVVDMPQQTYLVYSILESAGSSVEGS